MYTQNSIPFQIGTTTSRTDLETLICEYGDDTFDSFNVTQDMNNPTFKKSYSNLPSNLEITENLNIPENSAANRYILTNTEFSYDVLLNSFDILPSKTGFVTLSILTFQFQCNISCNNQLQQLNSNILDSRYKIVTNMTFEIRNLSLHTFYFNDSKIPLQAGKIKYDYYKIQLIVRIY